MCYANNSGSQNPSPSSHFDVYPIIFMLFIASAMVAQRVTHDIDAWNCEADAEIFFNTSLVYQARITAVS